MLSGANSWQHACYYLSPDVVEYTTNVDRFAYTAYADILFEGWQDFAESDQYPEEPDWADDYLEGHTRIVLWRVLDRFVESGVFSSLRLSAPFRLGYQFHEEGVTVLCILNWPSVL